MRIKIIASSKLHGNIVDISSLIGNEYEVLEYDDENRPIIHTNNDDFDEISIFSEECIVVKEESVKELIKADIKNPNTNIILPQIFFDMDCCIYDLNAVICKHYNHDFKDNKLPSDNKSYFFDEFNKASHPYFMQLLNQKGIFFEGEPIGNSVEIINKLHSENYEIYFLSLPMNNKYCSFEKKEWLKKYFKWIDIDKDVIFTGNKRLLDNFNRIIYDDNVDYLNWEKGINICYIQPWNDKYEGEFKIKSHDEFYELVHELDKL